MTLLLTVAALLVACALCQEEPEPFFEEEYTSERAG